MTTQAPRKSATLQDVARAAGISKATASLALNGDSRISPQTRDVVLEAARSLRYRANPIARSLSRGWRDTMVGLFTMGLDLGSRTRSVKLIQESLNARGFEVPVHVYGAPQGASGGTEGSGTSMRNLCAQRPRAIVCNTSSDLAPDVVDELRAYGEQGGIVVCYDHDLGLGCDQVLFDREAYTYHSAAHLLSLGHRRLALGPSGTITTDHPWAKGFLRAHVDFGVAPWEGWLLAGSEYEEGGMLLADQFLARKNRPIGTVHYQRSVRVRLCKPGAAERTARTGGCERCRPR
jgi:DNA-binding LacI/PurR family transcriptional regulator